MRARRRFQPSLDSMPMRLAPSALVVSPSNYLAGAGTATVIVCPIDALSGSDYGSSGSSTIATGSFPALVATAAC